MRIVRMRAAALMRPAQEAMRTHYKRNHANQSVELQPVRVQAFYGRSAANPQLRYVEVAEDNTTATTSEIDTEDITKFGIPANSSFAYKLREWLDLAELEMFQTPDNRSFKISKRLLKSWKTPVQTLQPDSR
ncbi:hypothetical protein V1509DRAFT_640043 [Lipomyces kononenkoae]